MPAQRRLWGLLLRALVLKFIEKLDFGVADKRRGLCYDDVHTAHTGVTSSLRTPRN